MIAGFGAGVGTIEQAADLIAWLAGDEAAFRTGGDYRVDGRLTTSPGV